MTAPIEMTCSSNPALSQREREKRGVPCRHHPLDIALTLPVGTRCPIGRHFPGDLSPDSRSADSSGRRR